MAKKAKTTKAKKKPVVARRKSVAKPKKKRTSKLMQQTYSVSAALQAIGGGKSLTRPQIVKKMWEYIKANKCQDIKNSRLINPDKKLSEVIGARPVDMLKLAGLLSKHIK